MRRLASFALGLTLALGSSTALAQRASKAPSAAAAPKAARTRSRPLPRTVGLGAVTIDRYSDARRNVLMTTSVFAPLATQSFPGTIKNINAKAPSDPLPRRFIIGDGGTTRVFIGVDLRPGSLLTKKLDRIIGRIPKRADGSRDAEEVIEYLRSNVNDIIKWAPGSSANDGRASLPWDLALKVGPSAQTAYQSVSNEAVGHAPRDAGQDYSVVPFEHYLRKGQGYCIQKALLASLVLDRLGIPHRLVNGAVLTSGGSTGHTWLELGDGRVFDPAWSTIAPRGAPSSAVAKAYAFSGSERLENDFYPVLEAAPSSAPP